MEMCIIRTLKGRYFTGRKFSRDKDEAQVNTRDKTLRYLKILRKKGCTVIHEVVE